MGEIPSSSQLRKLRQHSSMTVVGGDHSQEMCYKLSDAEELVSKSLQ